MSLPHSDDAQPTRTTPAVTALIAALVAGFVVRFGLVGEATSEFVGFSPDAIAERWWTVVTYPFATPRPLVLAVNLLALWTFGPRVEEAWGTRRFLGFLLACALGGALLHFLIGDAGDPLLGPTAAIFGLMVAHVRLWRDAEVWLFGVTPIAARAVVAALAVGTLIAGLGAADTYMGEPQLSTLSHLGGAAMAFLFLRVPQRERIEQLRQRISPVPDVSEDIARPIPRTPPRPRERPEEIDEIVARSKAVVARRRDPGPRVRRPIPDRKPPADELDRVLDKISAQGMDSLSSEEKEILERSAKRLKGD